MHVCPVDCHWCAEPGCRTDGCALASHSLEAVLLPCTGCGTLTIIRAHVHFCTVCATHEAVSAAALPPTPVTA